MTFINGFLVMVGVAFSVWLRILYLQWKGYENTCEYEDECNFYCQRDIELNPPCKKQCEHCELYYKPLKEGWYDK